MKGRWEAVEVLSVISVRKDSLINKPNHIQIAKLEGLELDKNITYYAHLDIINWESIIIQVKDSTTTLKGSPNCDSIGFFHVYDSLEKLLKVFPHSVYMVVKPLARTEEEIN